MSVCVVPAGTVSLLSGGSKQRFVALFVLM